MHSTTSSRERRSPRHTWRRRGVGLGSGLVLALGWLAVVPAAAHADTGAIPTSQITCPASIGNFSAATRHLPSAASSSPATASRCSVGVPKSSSLDFDLR